MKKIILLLSLLLSSFAFSQNIFWYDVLLEVDSKNASTVAGLVDGFYSNHPKASNVTVEFSSIPLKGTSENATHIISISSDSSKSLADFRNSLKGDDWDLYISKMQNYIKSSRASAGKSLLNFGSDIKYPIGQAWVFKVENSDLNTFVEAFSKLMKSIKFDGFVGVGQIIHGTDNGESVYIYATYSDLNSAFSFGPKNDKESTAFSAFSKAIQGSEYSKTFTRVLINRN
tara:strand:+ start:756 stop:1442 length:687 start_codon:yes stop_codon:yes gene_type:complete